MFEVGPVVKTKKCGHLLESYVYDNKFGMIIIIISFLRCGVHKRKMENECVCGRILNQGQAFALKNLSQGITLSSARMRKQGLHDPVRGSTRNPHPLETSRPDARLRYALPPQTANLVSFLTCHGGHDQIQNTKWRKNNISQTARSAVGFHDKDKVGALLYSV